MVQGSNFRSLDMYVNDHCIHIHYTLYTLIFNIIHNMNAGREKKHAQTWTHITQYNRNW